MAVWLPALDGADFDVADDKAAGVDDAVADVAVDRNDADVTISLLIIINNVIHSVINTSSLVINIKISSISSSKSIIRMIINKNSKKSGTPNVGGDTKQV